MTTKQAARGKWDGILAQLIGEQAVSRKHTACPICGGSDRYRYDNNRNDGDWYCNHCGTGDGFKLLIEALGLTFAEAAKQVDLVVNNVEEKPFRPQIDIEQRRQLMNETWSLAQEPFFAFNYLIGRGIPSQIVEQIGSDVRGAEKLQLYDGKHDCGKHNAMLALIRNPKGIPISIHRTYLGVDGRQKKIMPPLENITGGCVRLGEPDDTLVLAEGIETALAAWCLLGHPAWATISAHGLAEFKSIPRHVKRVIIAADNDASFTGQEAAFACAKTMKQKLQVETVVTMPKTMGTDMLDLLNELRGDNTLLHGNEHQIGLMRWAP